MTTERATASLLWAACRPAPDIEACERARQAGADLVLAGQLSISQRVSGLLWRVVEPWLGGIAGGMGAGIDGGVAEAVRRDVKRTQGQALLLRPQLAGLLLEPLASAGVEAVVFKGAAIAERYPAAGLRPMDDVDLLLPRPFHPPALLALTDNGWRVIPPQEGHYETVLVHPRLPGLPLEMHGGLALPGEAVSTVSLEALWERRRRVSVAGAPAFALDPETELVALAAHAAKPFHVFERLLWSVDIAVVIESAGSIDWDETERLASEAKVRSALAVALQHGIWLGADSPERLRQVAAGGTRRAALRPVLDPSWPVVPRDEGTRHRLAYALTDDPMLRLRRAVHDVTGDGVAQVLRRACRLAWLFWRRWRALRSGGGQPGGISSSSTIAS